jgi:hypothetical protein
MLRGVPALPPEMSRMDAINWVIEHHQCALIDGVAVDAQSANAISTGLRLADRQEPREVSGHADREDGHHRMAGDRAGAPWLTAASPAWSAATGSAR